MTAPSQPLKRGVFILIHCQFGEQVLLAKKQGPSGHASLELPRLGVREGQEFASVVQGVFMRATSLIPSQATFTSVAEQIVRTPSGDAAVKLYEVEISNAESLRTGEGFLWVDREGEELEMALHEFQPDTPIRKHLRVVNTPLNALFVS